MPLDKRLKSSPTTNSVWWPHTFSWLLAGAAASHSRTCANRAGARTPAVIIQHTIRTWHNRHSTAAGTSPVSPSCHRSTTLVCSLRVARIPPCISRTAIPKCMAVEFTVLPRTAQRVGWVDRQPQGQPFCELDEQQQMEKQQTVTR